VERAEFCAVSEAAARVWRAKGVPVRTVLWNGLDLSTFPYRPDHGDYLLFAGRIAPEKGPELAIEVAAEVNLPMLLVGGAYDPGFYRRVVQPRVRVQSGAVATHALPPGATYLGERPRAEVVRLMSGARALIAPVRWEEPFGLVAIEAQATGTPVVAFRRGGLLEVVDDGRTGFLAPPDDVGALTRLVGRVEELDRPACRAWVSHHFSLDRMLERHLQLYSELVI
jgi:glycosyltransferase involved in cell wall biosynthesis